MSYTIEFWALPLAIVADIAHRTESPTEFGEGVKDAGVYFGWIGHSSSGGDAFRSELRALSTRLGIPLESWIIGPNSDLPYQVPEDSSGYPSFSGFTSAQATDLCEPLEQAIAGGEMSDSNVLDVEMILSVALDARDRATDITTIYW